MLVISCTEGKLLSVLTDINLVIFKSTIRDLLQQVQQKILVDNFDYDAVMLVILYIGSRGSMCNLYEMFSRNIKKYK